MNANTDQFFIDKTLQGDTRAFGVLVERHQEMIFTMVLRMLKVREEAEEVAQDTFIKAFESLSNFRGESKFSSWLYRIAYRKALDRIRANKRQRTSQLIEAITETEIASIEDGLQYMEQKERTAIIRECILQLPETEAAVVTLYYFESQSVKEIAAITELSTDNVKIKLYRSRKKLFSLLKGYVQPEITRTNGKAI
ncbi:MAG: RNA polymerase sigma factor [Flavobacteriales bacterium]|jgi:RNA polymerase sigma factor (sigma-70 family)|uniref:RNA polymerase sigma factor n=1 Tax=Candidatus Ulvibacter alkanivorans TaxID=2267620 RepID=UPI000DF2576A|nr:RNA polymerase sigma factor [Candidatus Ulvibacter alkanivorans]MCH2489657.1 RNA polymerase sigma factor [Flavobacteriales bacterium]